MQLPRGKSRRQILDDITVGVLVCGDVSGAARDDLVSTAPADVDSAVEDGASLSPGIVYDLIGARKPHAEVDFS